MTRLRQIYQRFPRRTAEAFFPATCLPPLNRRKFLMGAGALLAGSAVSPGVGRAASDDGRAIIQKYSTVPEDAWAVAHGIRAMGRDFAIRGGRRAVDYLLGNVLLAVPANGKRVLAFPDVEGHPNAFLKTFLEAGVPPEYAFTHDGTRRTLGDVVAGARALFRPHQVLSVPNALP
jgi:hypothetical protein